MESLGNNELTMAQQFEPFIIFQELLIIYTLWVKIICPTWSFLLSCLYIDCTHCIRSYILIISWWRNQMGTCSALLAICAGNSPVPVNSPHRGQWRGALMFPLICARKNGWVNNREAGDLRRNRTHYDVNVMIFAINLCMGGLITSCHGTLF